MACAISADSRSCETSGFPAGSSCCAGGGCAPQTWAVHTISGLGLVGAESISLVSRQRPHPLIFSLPLNTTHSLPLPGLTTSPKLNYTSAQPRSRLTDDLPRNIHTHPLQPQAFAYPKQRQPGAATHWDVGSRFHRSLTIFTTTTSPPPSRASPRRCAVHQNTQIETRLKLLQPATQLGLTRP